jgi:hypothetical protein
MTWLPVTWLPFMSHPLAMLLPVMHNCTFRTTAMVRKKARECPSGHVQNILPVMTSLPVTWLHVTSFPVRAASGDVTSSNAYAMARSPLLPPKYSLSCPDTLLWYLDAPQAHRYLKKKLWMGGLYKYPMKNILRTAKFLTTWGVNQRYFPGL